MGDQPRFHLTSKRTSQSGFSLVELAVVLVVIGVILAAISIGRDLHRGAEGLQMYAKFIQPWAIAYNEYFARTGVVVGDDPQAPTLMVNEGAGEICGEDLGLLMDSVGIEMPPGRGVGMESLFVFLDSNGNPQQAEICFDNVEWEGSINTRNVMHVKGVNPDMARRLDSIIDSTPNACSGLLRQAYETPPGPPAATSCTWDFDNRYNFVGNPTNLDEDQVVVVEAFYRMDQ